MFLILDLLSLCAAGGAYAVYDFSRRKLGMQRWVNYQTMRVQKLLPLDRIVLLAELVIVLCLLALLFAFFKSRKQRGKMPFSDKITLFLSAVYGAGFLFLSIAFSVKQLSSYYLVLLLIGIAFLCVGIRNYLSFKNR